MGSPAITKFTAAGMVVNQSITFASLLTTQGTYITGITNQAIAKGMVCAGSSNGVTAAMDGVNRCTTAAGFAVRGANTTTAQSWIVITHANGAQTLFAFTGASDDICRISGSPGGLFVVAGTATFAPTAIDEVVGISATTIIGATASGNRVYNVQIDSAHNGWRAFIFSAGIMCGPAIFGELFDTSQLNPATATCAVPTWWGCVAPTTAGSAPTLMGAFSSNSNGGSTRMLVSAVAKTVTLGSSGKSTSGQFAAENNLPQELNGGLIPFRSIGVHSTTATARGDVGKRFDWYMSNEFKKCGELDSGLNWVNLNNTAVDGANPGLLWTWNGVTTPVQTS